MQKVVLWHVVLCACLLHTRHRLSDTPKRSSSRGRRLLRQRVMRRPIMQQAVRHKSSSRKPPSPLFPTMLEHPESDMQNVVLWHVLLRAIFSNPPLRPTAPPKRSSARGRKASAASCGHPSCSRSSATRLPHAYLHHPSSPPGSSIQSLACKMYCYGMTFCVPACFTRRHRKDPLLHPSAPRPGVERLLRQRVMRRPIMQTAVRHMGFLTHTSITPLPYQAPASRVWHAKCSAMACRICVPACSHVTASQTHCSTQALLAQGSRGFCVSASCGDHHAAGRQTQGFLTQTSITPLPYQARASRVWHAKCSAMACRFACLLVTRHRL